MCAYRRFLNSSTNQLSRASGTKNKNFHLFLIQIKKRRESCGTRGQIDLCLEGHLWRQKWCLHFFGCYLFYTKRDMLGKRLYAIYQYLLRVCMSCVCVSTYIGLTLCNLPLRVASNFLMTGPKVNIN